MKHQTTSVIVWLIVSACGIVGSMRLSGPFDPQRIAGCYMLKHESWPDDLEQFPSSSTLPDRLKLTTAPSGDGLAPRGSFAIEYPPDFDLLPFTYWTMRESGLELGAPRPVSFRLRLALVENSEFAGTLSGLTDFAPEDDPLSHRVPARLIPTECWE